MSKVAWASALLLAAAACARPPPAPGATAASLAASVPARSDSGPRHDSREAKVAALRFDLNGRAFPLPLVHGTVGGEPVWMLVDTGANSHVIAGWVARKLKMPLRPLGEVGSDHTGRAMNAYAVLRAKASIDGWGAIDSGPMVVADVPEPIARIGIGAFVSPQALATDDEGVVLDLAHHEMRRAPWADAVRWLDAGAGSPIGSSEGARFCESDMGFIRGLAFVVPAEIDGRKVYLLLDTGAHHTDLLTTSRAGSALSARSTASGEPMYAASGLVRTRVVRAARVKLGGWAMTTDLDLVPGSADRTCPRDGAVSMDVLAQCTLVLGRRALLGRCGS